MNFQTRSSIKVLNEVNIYVKKAQKYCGGDNIIFGYHNLDKIFIYIMENRDKIVFIYLLYEHVEYNGNAYYMAKNQRLSSSGSKKGTPVYLVYKGDKIYYESCDSAEVFTGYEGEEEIYIFFDSAIFIREDYWYIEDNQQ